MDISKQRSRCIRTLREIHQAPSDLTQALEDAPITRYLDIIAELALRPRLTDTIFATHGNVFVAISSRWLIRPHDQNHAKLAAYARILPCAPYLAVHLAKLLNAGDRAILTRHSTAEVFNPSELPFLELTDLLISILRLLKYDRRTYTSYLFATHMVSLLEHEQQHVRYLAVRILALFLNASDIGLSRMLDSHVRTAKVSGPWEGKTIDYAWYTLWEHSRLQQLKDLLKSFDHGSEPGQNHAPFRLSQQHLSSTSVAIGRVLLPISHHDSPETSPFVWTTTTENNLERLAFGLNTPRSLLVAGAPGSGKSATIKELAAMTGNSASMVTLHINDQVDTKMLLGTYATETSNGMFSWQPGVLTRAVTEGRWVVVEDIDRASMDFLSVLRPLLDKRALLMSHTDMTQRCAPGFRLFGTISNTTGSLVPGKASHVGFVDASNWHLVELESPSSEDIKEILLDLFPTVRGVLPALMLIYSDLASVYPTRTRRARRSRLTSLLRLSRRIHQDLHDRGCTTGFEPIAAATDHQTFPSEDIFLNTVDCFVGHLPRGVQKTKAIDVIGKALNIPPERMKHALEMRRPSYAFSKDTVQIGRAKLQVSRSKHTSPRVSSTSFDRFALTDHFLRRLESVMTSVKFAEPCLLIGETGTGKTSLVQYLATLSNKKLEVLNLSQQSEAGDLLGGFKPINLQSLAFPMKDEFHDLLHLTFPTGQNQRYLEAQSKAISHQRWRRVLDLWKAACQRIRPILERQLSATLGALQEPNKKRRKLRMDYQELKSRWSKFQDRVEYFEVELSNGHNGFAFTFRESRLVHALRNGDWVLLDEINLASPETLDSLADLFDSVQNGPPSLLLPEGGKIERVHGHADFRIFGAMNPPTDVGKQDLPPAIVSRFAEIFFEPPDKNLVDLEAIVKASLGQHCYHDKHIASDLGKVYLEVAELAENNSIVDASNQKPHLSLRTFSRALVYTADMLPWYGLRRAAFEGFSMCMLAELDEESSEKVFSLIVKRLYESVKKKEIAERKMPQLPKDGRTYIAFEQYWLLKGALNEQTRPEYILTPSVRQNLLNLVRATSTRRFPVLLQGPTSSGKTSMVQYLAHLSGNAFVRINNHEHTDLQEYLGTYTSDASGQLHYQDGVLVRALREGHWVVLDELNLAPSDVLEALNRLLDDNRELLVPETQEIVRPHQNFMLFATQNPPGLYGGRKHLSRAFKNRFLCLHFGEIPENELEQILRERAQIAPSFCTNIVEVYKKLAAHRQSSRLFEHRHSFATLRDLFRWASRSVDSRQLLAEEGFMLLGERVRDVTERAIVLRCIEETMNVKIDMEDLYGHKRCDGLVAQTPEQLLSIERTRSMRRLLILVTQALKNDEPVLLVGETGCGKTTVCQVAAQLACRKLHTINAHRNLETGDMIGAHRPLRDRNVAIDRLKNLLLEVFRSHNVLNTAEDEGLDGLINHYDRLMLSETLKLPLEVAETISSLRSYVKSLFEWSDGSVVTAMKKGDYVLLDEIALADDSVLERLNSVLEPGRSLYLAEKGIIDSEIIASPGFEFLATMNPGGDYGKRELSNALRNRFTEIWVPPLTVAEEFQEIVESKLAHGNRHLAKSMVEFAFWFVQEYGSPFSKVSMRDLLAWTDFVEACKILDLPQAILNGASMTYIDKLGTNPASISIPYDLDIKRARETCVSKLTGLFCLDIDIASQQPLTLVDNVTEFKIGHYALVKHEHAPEPSTFSFRAPTIRHNAMKVMRALQLSKPILLEGDPGVGKTSLIAALAEKAGRKLVRINLSDQTDLIDLFGSDVPVDESSVGNFEWRDAAFLAAMRSGDWVLLDEMNLAPQSVLEGLNACFDHRGEVFISELSQTFPKHPNFTAFAAQNPHHRGAGRKGLPRSFIDRFTVVFADTLTTDDLMTICTESTTQLETSTTKDIVKCVQRLDQLVNKPSGLRSTGGPWEFNLRDALRWLQLISMTECQNPPVDPLSFASLLLVQRFRQAQDRYLVTQAIEEIFHKRMPMPELRPFRTKGKVQVGHAQYENVDCVAEQNDGRQGDGLPLTLMESALSCINMKWPVLLVGPNQQEKMDLVQSLADLTGSAVLRICLHPDIDAQDFLGAFDQFDVEKPYGQFLKQLKEYTRRMILEQQSLDGSLLSRLFTLLASIDKPAESSALADALRATSAEFPRSRLSSFLSDLKCLQDHDARSNSARFVWKDGILLQAVKQGKWLILEDANLCDSSVLDRLNSLLETQGVMVVNEHKTSDYGAELVKPHPCFRIFLTTDPRHGELSQAMRNRCVEIFVPTQSELPRAVCPALDSNFEADVSRFAMFQIYEFDRQDESLWTPLLFIALDHLDFVDLEHLEDWHSQVTESLLTGERGFLLRVTFVVNVYLQLTSSDNHLIQAMKRTYYDASHQQRRVMGIHPYNNISIHSEHHDLTYMSSLGHWFELLMRVLTIATKVNAASSVGRERPFRDMNLLQLSFYAEESLLTEDINWSHLLRRLPVVLQSVRDLINDQRVRHGGGEIALEFIRNVLYFLQDLIDLAESADYDNGKLVLLVSQCTKFLRNKAAIEWSYPPSAAQPRDLLFGWLQTMQSKCRITTGLGMTEMWHRLRPRMPRSQDQFILLSKVRQCMRRFDQVKLWSGADLEYIASVHEKLTLLLGSCYEIECDSNDFNSVFDASKAIEQKSFQVAATHTPTFVSEFQILRQYECCQESAITKLDRQLFLLSGEPSDRWLQSSSGHDDGLLTLKIFLNSLGGDGLETMLDVPRMTLPIKVFRQLSALPSVSLGSLSLLRAEIQKMIQSVILMSDIISADPQHSIAGKLQGVQNCIKRALRPFASTTNVQELMAAIDGLPRLKRAENTPAQTQSSLHNDRKVSHYLKDCVNQLISYPSFVKPSNMTELASSIIKHFTGCLLLFVPDQPFDPLEKIRFNQERILKRRTELEAYFEALKYFEKKNTGQSSSHRLQMIEQEIQSIDIIETERLWRRTGSSVESLRGTFEYILRSIILQPPITDDNCAVLANDTEHIAALERLRQASHSAIERVLQGDFGLDDITQPLAAFLSGLHGGLSMALCAYDSKEGESYQVAQLCSRTPLMGGGCRYLAQELESIRGKSDLSVESWLSVLDISAFERLLRTPSSAPIDEVVLEAFHQCYNAWKVRFEHDKVLMAKSRSLYRYRDEEAEDDQDVLARELANLFSDTDKDDTRRGPMQETNTELQSLAMRLATLHQKTFDPVHDPNQQILSLMRAAPSKILSLWQVEDQCAAFPWEASNMLPSLVLKLDDELEKLKPSTSKSSIPNFYKDSHVLEAENFIDTVSRTRKRFEVLQEAWPDHTTIKEVLCVCDSALDMRHTEPLAKYITKLEQLHSFVAEWQTVASLEFSAAAQYDNITQLIISWRRLELTTWQHLLKAEDQACEAEAKNWWFVAYENIIAVPLSSDVLESSSNAFTSDLLETLSQFISTTAAGQYSSRISLLSIFLRHVRLIGSSRPSIRPVADALSNFLRYHARYETNVKDFLADGRARVEKELKETLLLASWKDTNIHALRESVSRSHHKLFKLVREYRKILASPVNGLLTRTEILAHRPSSFSRSVPSGLRNFVIDTSALMTCQSSVDVWKTVPDRLKNPAITASRMQSICQMPHQMMTTDTVLKEVTDSLRYEVEALQLLTNDKEAQSSPAGIKNVTSRKRQLLFEAMRHLRSMGFKPSLSQDHLNRQDTLAKILAQLPDIMSHSKDHAYDCSDTIDILFENWVVVRDLTKAPHSDIGSAVAHKAGGLLESMLASIIDQRRATGRTTSALIGLEKCLESLHALWRPNEYKVRSHNSSSTDLERSINWLPPVTHAVRYLSRKCEHRSSMDCAEYLAVLQTMNDDFDLVAKAIGELPRLPAGLTTSKHDECYSQASQKKLDAHLTLQRLSSTWPKQRFLLQQIMYWTEPVTSQQTPEKVQTKYLDAAQIIFKFCHVADDILLSIQRISKILESMPKSGSNKKWLSYVDNIFKECLQKSRAGEILESLELCLSDLGLIDASEPKQLEIGSAFCYMILPIVQQYHEILTSIVSRYAALHASTTDLALFCTKTLAKILREGFCVPEDKDGAENGKQEIAQEGVGLGEGTGLDNISSEVAQDEDLSELGNTMVEKDVDEKPEEKEDQDAIDMQSEDLEGQLGETAGQQAADDEEDEDEATDVEEVDETIDQMDGAESDVVDEKFWDAAGAESTKRNDNTDPDVELDHTEDAKSSFNPRTEQNESGRKDSDFGMSEISSEDQLSATAESVDGSGVQTKAEDILDVSADLDLDHVDGSEPPSMADGEDLAGLSDLSSDPEMSDKDTDFDDVDDPPSPSRESDHINNDTEWEGPQSRSPSPSTLSQTRGLSSEPDSHQAASDKKVENDEGENVQGSASTVGVTTGAPSTPPASSQTGEADTKQEIAVNDGVGGEAQVTNDPKAWDSAQDQNNSALRLTDESTQMKQLGDALERWHRSHRPLQQAGNAEDRQMERPQFPSASLDQFEHVASDSSQFDTQALAQAEPDQAKPLDAQQLAAETQNTSREDKKMDIDHEDQAQTLDHTNSKSVRHHGANHDPGARAPTLVTKQGHQQSQGDLDQYPEEDLEMLDASAEEQKPTGLDTSHQSLEQARAQWQIHERSTHELAIGLTEELRLILRPTQAAKLRGDFRTGKRLNLKRIIPYIASGYKRDKIWLRRSAPSKRNYQVLIAIDDSKSMEDSDNIALTFQSLALITRSLTMLEAGEVCVIGFGDEVTVAHDFGGPFSSEAGAQVCRQLSFGQERTRVDKLMSLSIDMLEQARRKNSHISGDIWQLELIISDGNFNDHDLIRRQVRHAQESRIMIVFIIVDSLNRGGSILDTKKVEWETSANGNTEMKVKDYLERFPFPYYLIVSNVEDLPGVLAQALKQWFIEVADSAD